MKNLFLVLFALSFFRSVAQEPLMPLPVENDSVAMAAERQFMYNQLLSGGIWSGELMNPVQPLSFNFQQQLENRWNYAFTSPETFFSGSFSPGLFSLGFAPFLRDATVVSGATYRLNDKFSIGGYSFGANSVFSAPFPNQGMNNFDFRGNTLFLKYNVSKNFKIETRVNVTHGPGF